MDRYVRYAMYDRLIVEYKNIGKPGMYTKIICLIFCLVGSIYCKDIMYVGYNYPTSFYNCFRQAGHDQIILFLEPDFED